MIVTSSILREAGYPVGALKDEAVISLAERQVMAAYFPTTETFETSEAKDLLYALTFSLLLKRKSFAARYGSVQKQSQYTIQADNEQIRQEIRGYCRQPLESYIAAYNEAAEAAALEAGEDYEDFEPEDILEIYDKLFLI